MEYELCLNGLLLSDILPYPLFHCHVGLPIICVGFTVCLMSRYFRYPELTASGYLNLASVIAGRIHVAWRLLQPCSMKAWVAISMWSDSPPMYICIQICVCMCMCMCICICICICACTCTHARRCTCTHLHMHAHAHTHAHIYIYIYIYIVCAVCCVHVCVHVWHVDVMTAHE